MASKLNSQNQAHASHFFGRLLKSFVHELMLLVTLDIVIDKRTVCSNWTKLESCSEDMSEENQQNKLDSEMALFLVDLVLWLNLLLVVMFRYRYCSTAGKNLLKFFLHALLMAPQHNVLLLMTH